MDIKLRQWAEGHLPKHSLEVGQGNVSVVLFDCHVLSIFQVGWKVLMDEFDKIVKVCAKLLQLQYVALIQYWK